MDFVTRENSVPGFFLCLPSSSGPGAASSVNSTIYVLSVLNVYITLTVCNIFEHVTFFCNNVTIWRNNVTKSLIFVSFSCRPRLVLGSFLILSPARPGGRQLLLSSSWRPLLALWPSYRPIDGRYTRVMFNSSFGRARASSRALYAVLWGSFGVQPPPRPPDPDRPPVVCTVSERLIYAVRFPAKGVAAPLPWFVLGSNWARSRGFFTALSRLWAS